MMHEWNDLVASDGLEVSFSPVSMRRGRWGWGGGWGVYPAKTKVVLIERANSAFLRVLRWLMGRQAELYIFSFAFLVFWQFQKKITKPLTDRVTMEEMTRACYRIWGGWNNASTQRVGIDDNILYYPPPVESAHPTIQQSVDESERWKVTQSQPSCLWWAIVQKIG